MTKSNKFFGTKSYPFAIGAVKATDHKLLTNQQWKRLMEADEAQVLKLLDEFGYGADSKVVLTVEEKIEEELTYTFAFIMDMAPDPELAGLLFFAEDAHNLKLFLKAAKGNQNVDELVSHRGYFDPEVMRLCVAAGDYTMIGADVEKELTGIQDETDPQVISRRADNAIINHSYNVAKKKRNRMLMDYFSKYAEAEDRINTVHFFDETLSDTTSIGPLAQYYLSKKNEARDLRILFAKKRMGMTVTDDDFDI